MPELDLDTTIQEIAAWRSGWQEAAAQLASLGSGVPAPTPAEPPKAADGSPDAPATVDRGASAIRNPYLHAGDPTVEQYRDLPGAVMAELEDATPGVGERMAKAAKWD